MVRCELFENSNPQSMCVRKESSLEQRLSNPAKSQTGFILTHGDINEDINLALRETQVRKLLEITWGK